MLEHYRSILKKRLKKNLFFLINDYPYRKYLRKNKCIFIHIPKNAGTSILMSLSKGKKIHRDHLTWKQFHAYNPYRFDKYFKFSIVRNPFDRVVSTYSYLLNGGNQDEDLSFKEYFNANNITFEKFVLEYLNHNRIFEHMIFAPQYIYVYDHHYNLKVDYIGKYENLEKDFIELSQKIKGLKQLNKHNISKRKSNYLEYYSNKKVVEKVIALYKNDFILFEYKEEI